MQGAKLLRGKFSETPALRDDEFYHFNKGLRSVQWKFCSNSPQYLRCPCSSGKRFIEEFSKLGCPTPHFAVPKLVIQSKDIRWVSAESKDRPIFLRKRRKTLRGAGNTHCGVTVDVRLLGNIEMVDWEKDVKKGDYFLSHVNE